MSSSTKPEAPVVPDGWRAVWDDKRGKYYFYNKATKETTWAVPNASVATTSRSATDASATSGATSDTAAAAVTMGKPGHGNVQTAPLDGDSAQSSARARPGAASPAAAGAPKASWRGVTDASGRTYYYNRVTKETTWKRPPEMDASEDADPGREKGRHAQTDAQSKAVPATHGDAPKSTGASSMPAATVAVDSDAAALPVDWKAVPDPKSGKTYYYNRRTKETTWTKPLTAPAGTPDREPHDDMRHAHPVPAASSAPVPEQRQNTDKVTAISAASNAPASEPTAKPVWRQVEDKKTGRSYWYNRVTKVTQWTKPSDEELNAGLPATRPEQPVIRSSPAPALAHEDKSSAPESPMLPAQATAVAGSETNAFSRTAEPPRPTEWRQVADPKSGKPYYYNRRTKETRWQAPQEWTEYEELLAQHRAAEASNDTVAPSSIALELVTVAHTGSSFATQDDGLGASGTADKPQADQPAEHAMSAAADVVDYMPVPAVAPAITARRPSVPKRVKPFVPPPAGAQQPVPLSADSHRSNAASSTGEHFSAQDALAATEDERQQQVEDSGAGQSDAPVESVVRIVETASASAASFSLPSAGFGVPALPPPPSAVPLAAAAKHDSFDEKDGSVRDDRSEEMPAAAQELQTAAAPAFVSPYAAASMLFVPGQQTTSTSPVTGAVPAAGNSNTLSSVSADPQLRGDGSSAHEGHQPPPPSIFARPLEKRPDLVMLMQSHEQELATQRPSGDAALRDAVPGILPIALPGAALSPRSAQQQLSGYLLKKSRTGWRGWLRRFFVTHRWLLMYYTSHEQPADSPLAVLDLRFVSDLRLGHEVGSRSRLNVNMGSDRHLRRESDASEDGSDDDDSAEVRGLHRANTWSWLPGKSPAGESDAACLVELAGPEIGVYTLRAENREDAVYWYNGLLTLLHRYGCLAQPHSALGRRLAQRFGSYEQYMDSDMMAIDVAGDRDESRLERRSAKPTKQTAVGVTDWAIEPGLRRARKMAQRSPAKKSTRHRDAAVMPVEPQDAPTPVTDNAEIFDAATEQSPRKRVQRGRGVHAADAVATDDQAGSPSSSGRGVHFGAGVPVRAGSVGAASAVRWLTKRIRSLSALSTSSSRRDARASEVAAPAPRTRLQLNAMRYPELVAAHPPPPRTAGLSWSAVPAQTVAAPSRVLTAEHSRFSSPAHATAVHATATSFVSAGQLAGFSPMLSPAAMYQGGTPGHSTPPDMARRGVVSTTPVTGGGAQATPPAASTPLLVVHDATPSRSEMSSENVGVASPQVVALKEMDHAEAWQPPSSTAAHPSNEEARPAVPPMQSRRSEGTIQAADAIERGRAIASFLESQIAALRERQSRLEEHVASAQQNPAREQPQAPSNALSSAWNRMYADPAATPERKSVSEVPADVAPHSHDGSADPAAPTPVVAKINLAALLPVVVEAAAQGTPLDVRALAQQHASDMNGATPEAPNRSVRGYTPLTNGSSGTHVAQVDVLASPREGWVVRAALHVIQDMAARAMAPSGTDTVLPPSGNTLSRLRAASATRMQRVLGALARTCTAHARLGGARPGSATAGTSLGSSELDAAVATLTVQLRSSATLCVALASTLHDRTDIGRYARALALCVCNTVCASPLLYLDVLLLACRNAMARVSSSATVVPDVDHALISDDPAWMVVHELVSCVPLWLQFMVSPFLLEPSLGDKEAIGLRGALVPLYTLLAPYAAAPAGADRASVTDGTWRVLDSLARTPCDTYVPLDLALAVAAVASVCGGSAAQALVSEGVVLPVLHALQQCTGGGSQGAAGAEVLDLIRRAFRGSATPGLNDLAARVSKSWLDLGCELASHLQSTAVLARHPILSAALQKAVAESRSAPLAPARAVARTAQWVALAKGCGGVIMSFDSLHALAHPIARVLSHAAGADPLASPGASRLARAFPVPFIAAAKVVMQDLDAFPARTDAATYHALRCDAVEPWLGALEGAEVPVDSGELDALRSIVLKFKVIVDESKLSLSLSTLPVNPAMAAEIVSAARRVVASETSIRAAHDEERAHVSFAERSDAVLTHIRHLQSEPALPGFLKAAAVPPGPPPPGSEVTKTVRVPSLSNMTANAAQTVAFVPGTASATARSLASELARLTAAAPVQMEPEAPRNEREITAPARLTGTEQPSVQRSSVQAAPTSSLAALLSGAFSPAAAIATRRAGAARAAPPPPLAVDAN